MNDSRLPKEDLLPDRVRRNKQGTQGELVK
jgi:hypothetical protein